jgi:anaerobic magnesium-protoporphyrin IX monomethyl ester cyclase
MAKILFINELWWESLSVMQLSSVLKQNSHEVLFHMYKNQDNLSKYIKETEPDCVGFSIMTSQHISALKVASFIKRDVNSSILTIFGGPHCTFMPEIINDDSVDIVVRGEGEGALLEIMNAIDKKDDFSNIKNVYIKHNSEIIKNELRPLIEDLDSLPFPDRGLFDKYLYYRNYPNRNIMTSRGCPFKCNFCFNKKYNELYQTKKLVRRRSVQNVISEIKFIKDKYPATKLIKFMDDMFTVNRKWFFSFLEAYNKDINLPFNCHIRADSETEETIKALAESNCTGVQFGIETGNEELRNSILNKKITNDQILNVTAVLKKYKLPFTTYNIFFVPGGTVDNAWETIKINQMVSPTTSQSHIFRPYPGTFMYEQLLKDNKISPDYWDRVDDMFAFPDADSDETKTEKKIYYLSNFLISFPRATPLFKKMINLIKSDFLFLTIFKLSAGIEFWLRSKLTLRRFLYELLYHYKTK